MPGTCAAACRCLLSISDGQDYGIVLVTQVSTSVRGRSRKVTQVEVQ